MKEKAKHVLIIAPYHNIYPPINGGMQRTFHIIHQLAKHFNTTCISYQETNQFLVDEKIFPSLKDVVYIKVNKQKNKLGIISKIWLGIMCRILRRSVFEPADINVISYYASLKKILKSNSFDAIVLENMSSLNMVGIIRRFTSNVPIIYDSHNVESDLIINKKSTLHKLVFNNESSLYSIVDHVWVCTHIDQQKIENMNKNLIGSTVIPNGTTIHLKRSNLENKKIILFCGSLDYYPNEEGLTWFIDHCWLNIITQSGDIELYIIGSGKRSSSLLIKLNHPAIKDFGFVHNVDMYYERAMVVIAPILSGSGSRLKILEAMSYFLPVVSTSKGAEGIEYTDLHNIIIADSSTHFTMNILQLVENSEKRNQVGSMAGQLAKEKYDWDIIGNKIALNLNSLG